MDTHDNMTTALPPAWGIVLDAMRATSESTPLLEPEQEDDWSSYDGGPVPLGPPRAWPEYEGPDVCTGDRGVVVG